MERPTLNFRDVLPSLDIKSGKRDGERARAVLHLELAQSGRQPVTREASRAMSERDDGTCVNVLAPSTSSMTPSSR